MSGARSRRKGANYERELVHQFREVMPGAEIKRGCDLVVLGTSFHIGGALCVDKVSLEEHDIFRVVELDDVGGVVVTSFDPTDVHHYWVKGIEVFCNMVEVVDCTCCV